MISSERPSKVRGRIRVGIRLVIRLISGRLRGVWAVVTAMSMFLSRA